MSSPMSPEQLARIRDHARRMVKRTGEHEHDLNVLVGTAEGMVEQAAALSVAFAATDSDAGDVERLCSVHVRRSVEHAEAVRRACVRAREQHVAARRLVTRVDGDSADAHTASPPAHARLSWSSTTPRMCATWWRMYYGTPGSSCERP